MRRAAAELGDRGGTRGGGGGGRGTVEVLVDDSTAVRNDGALDGATRVRAEHSPHRTVTLRVAGDDRFAAVLGSP